ncbi:MAG: hypothetical protein GTN86_01685 [Xanthomonadales bacterium]|nr:hypothetical protein [Xanthomonadales bacterium]NIN58730.1 hypothetical protein [Xanthomonadales bacterium]NIN73996.1 hypothetical protein [Xanthomonadales bacterium]NIO12911.1 hypothetical protein [Xanthomonadales bacterium]NIP11123.1 hypothetical protein [Xanthomonadales bacterium]
MLRKIVSGGQTGVDRGALDAALASGLECGGWCPEGRQAEDGAIPECYPVRELAGADFDQRTRQNVIDSDGTVVLRFGAAGGGTALTIRCARAHGKPLLEIDASRLHPRDAGEQLVYFVREHRIEVLNVAGPRASEAVSAEAYARDVLARLVGAG